MAGASRCRGPAPRLQSKADAGLCKGVALGGKCAFFSPLGNNRLENDGLSKKKGQVSLPLEFRRSGSCLIPLGVLACGLNVVGGERTRPGFRVRAKPVCPNTSLLIRTLRERRCCSGLCGFAGVWIAQHFSSSGSRLRASDFGIGLTFHSDHQLLSTGQEHLLVASLWSFSARLDPSSRP